MRGLLIGRFQPFHKGHLKAIKHILGEVDELIIVVGSSQNRRSSENPFTADERSDMIRAALEEEDLQRYEIHSIPDINDDDKYAAHVMGRVPPFDVIYSGNALVQRLFKKAGKEVREIEHYRREEYEGARIRRLIAEEGDWMSLVPEAVSKYIIDICGVERIKKLSTT